jgi:hypothetical protein
LISTGLAYKKCECNIKIGSCDRIHNNSFSM